MQSNLATMISFSRQRLLWFHRTFKKEGSESASPNPTSPWPCPRWTARAPRSPRSPTHKWRSGRSFYKVESSVRTAYITQVWEEFQSNFTHSKNMKHNKILMTSQIHLSFESNSKRYFWLKPETMERFRGRIRNMQRFEVKFCWNLHILGANFEYFSSYFHLWRHWLSKSCLFNYGY